MIAPRYRLGGVVKLTVRSRTVPYVGRLRQPWRRHCQPKTGHPAIGPAQRRSYGRSTNPFRYFDNSPGLCQPKFCLAVIRPGQAGRHGPIDQPVPLERARRLPQRVLSELRPYFSFSTQQPICIPGRALKVSRPVDNRFLGYIAARASQRSDAVRRTLPAPVKAALISIRAAAFKRRRSVIVLVVLAQHAAVLLLLAAMPPKPVPVWPIAMDVTLFRLEGPPSPIDRVPKPDQGGTDGETPEPTSDETERPEPAAPDSSQPTSEAAADAPSSPSVEVDASSATSEEASLDVLAMVEQITGSDVDTIAQAAPPATPVSNEQLRALLAAARPAVGGCSIEPLVQESLRGDAGVRASLASVPRDQLSISYAIQLWDGDWAHLATAGGEDVSASIRTVVAEAVDSAPQRCRNQLNEGPRFFIVPGGDNTVTVVVLGSGSWRWRDLLPPRRSSISEWFRSRTR